MTLTELRRLARLYSVQLTYRDAAGRTRRASPAALEAVVRTLAERREDLASSWIDPVSVVWGMSRPRIEVRLPDGEVEWAVELEDGTSRAGLSLVRGGVLHLPEILPYGYHTVRIRAGETLLIVAPAAAPAPRQRSWGICSRFTRLAPATWATCAATGSGSTSSAAVSWPPCRCWRAQTMSGAPIRH